MISGLILAAGESRRMNTAKALLTIGGVTFAEHIARMMRECKVDPVFLVAGAHIEEIHQRFEKSMDFTIIENMRYTHGQISSIKEGLRHLPTGAEAVMVWPVDQPLVKPETVRKMVAAFEQQPALIPVLDGKHGHPVIYGLLGIQSILSLKKGKTAKEVRTIFQDKICFLEVDDPGVLVDIDRPEDYQKHIPE